MATQLFLNYKITVPDNEIFEIKYDRGNSSKVLVGETPTTLEYSTDICEDGLIVFSNVVKREIWTSKKPIFTKVDGKTIVTFEQ